VPAPSPVRPCAFPCPPVLACRQQGCLGGMARLPARLSDPDAAKASMSPWPEPTPVPTISGCNGLRNPIYCAWAEQRQVCATSRGRWGRQRHTQFPVGRMGRAGGLCRWMAGAGARLVGAAGGVGSTATGRIRVGADGLGRGRRSGSPGLPPAGRVRVPRFRPTSAGQGPLVAFLARLPGRAFG
jgi:hypothetical protein